MPWVSRSASAMCTEPSERRRLEDRLHLVGGDSLGFVAGCAGPCDRDADDRGVGLQLDIAGAGERERAVTGAIAAPGAASRGGERGFRRRSRRAVSSARASASATTSAMRASERVRYEWDTASSRSGSPLTASAVRWFPFLRHGRRHPSDAAFVRPPACTRPARCPPGGCVCTPCRQRARRADALRADPDALAITLPELSSSATSRSAVESNVTRRGHAGASAPDCEIVVVAGARDRGGRRAQVDRDSLRDGVVLLEAVVVAERRRRAGCPTSGSRARQRRCAARDHSRPRRRSRVAPAGPGAPAGPVAPDGPGGPCGPRRFHVSGRSLRRQWQRLRRRGARPGSRASRPWQRDSTCAQPASRRG